MQRKGRKHPKSRHRTKISFPRHILEQSSQVGYKSPVAAIRGGTPAVFPFFYARHTEPPMSKVVIITTGGTIAMQHDSVTGAAVPAVSGADLVRAIPGLGSVCDLEVREFDNLPSPAITPDHMFRLAAMVRRIWPWTTSAAASSPTARTVWKKAPISSIFPWKATSLSVSRQPCAPVTSSAPTGRATSWRPCAWRPHARPATWAALWS